MPTAFVMINTVLGSEKEILDKIRKIDEIKKSFIVYGIHDITAIISTDTMEKSTRLLLGLETSIKSRQQ